MADSSVMVPCVSGSSALSCSSKRQRPPLALDTTSPTVPSNAAWGLKRTEYTSGWLTEVMRLTPTGVTTSAEGEPSRSGAVRCGGRTSSWRNVSPSGDTARKPCGATEDAETRSVRGMRTGDACVLRVPLSSPPLTCSETSIVSSMQSCALHLNANVAPVLVTASSSASRTSGSRHVSGSRSALGDTQAPATAVAAPGSGTSPSSSGRTVTCTSAWLGFRLGGALYSSGICSSPRLATVRWYDSVGSPPACWPAAVSSTRPASSASPAKDTCAATGTGKGLRHVSAPLLVVPGSAVKEVGGSTSGASPVPAYALRRIND